MKLAAFLVGLSMGPLVLPAGTCDALTNAGYVDSDGRLEFVIPFQGEPACECSPGPCNVKASATDAVLVRKFGDNITSQNVNHGVNCDDGTGKRWCADPPPPPKPARIVCWGRR